MNAIAPQAAPSDAAFNYVLRIADGCLVHGQRLAQWCGHAPVLEEDLALTNIALDHIGQARSLLTLAGALEGHGRDEDTLAYLRLEHEFVNATLLELPRGDFAFTVLRAFFWSSYMEQLCPALATSSNAELAGIAAKSLKEVRYHSRHLGDWVLRLGDGTEESHRRAAAALATLWPYTAELFESDPVDRAAAQAGLGPASDTLRPGWLRQVEPVLAAAGLVAPAATPFRATGRLGRHSEHMGPLLAEMQSLARAYPGAVW
jgi:ring-1,2-phenylacetyl-CoA epoxidase subunit PaaC